GEHPPRVGLVKSDMYADVAGVAFGQPYQLLFQGRFAAADDGQTTTRFDDGLADGHGEVDAFLLHQPGDDSKQRTLAWAKAEHLLHITRIRRLAFAVAGVKSLHQMMIGARVPVFVDAVGDTA